jgi:serine/threonine-protein kinase RsbW/stage II sporulation protein AB (anti-sigma F factor)
MHEQGRRPRRCRRLWTAIDRGAGAARRGGRVEIRTVIRDHPFGALAAGKPQDMDPAPLVRRFRAKPDQIRLARHEVAAYARQYGAADIDGIALAVSEAVSNAVLHAYIDDSEPGEIEVVAQRLPDDGLRVSVCDEGRGMRPRPDSPGLGLGLPLVATLAEQLEVQARPGGGTRVCMMFAAA